MRPFVRSYGLISSVTLSPGRMRMKFMRSLPGDVGENHVPARNLHLKRRVRQSFLNDSFYFNYVLF